MKKLQIALLAVPGAKRAACGVILPVADDEFLHIRSAIKCRDREGLSDDEADFLEFCSRTEILRLRELRGPHDYLLRLTANAIAESPRARRVMIARRKKFENSRRSWALSHY